MLNELNSQGATLSIDTMSVVVDYYTQKARKKAINFNCFVLARDNGDGDEFLDFLSILQENKEHFPDYTRFQVMFLDSGHWSAMDVRIKNGCLEFFIIDAANSLPQVLSAITAIHEKCPDSLTTYSGGSMQADEDNCAYFALEHAYALAKIPDLHDTLKEHVNTGKIGPFKNYVSFIESLIHQDTRILRTLAQDRVLNAVDKLQYVPTINFPKHFGSLLKHMQHLSIFDNHFAKKGFIRHNKKTLDAYIKDHTKPFKKDTYSQPHDRNFSIIDKIAKIKMNVLAYLSTINHAVTAILENRKNYTKELLALQKRSPSALDTKEAKKTAGQEETSSKSQKAIELDYLTSLPAMIRLKEAISALKTHGIEVAKEDEEKGLKAQKLAEKLEESVAIFITSNKGKPKAEIDLDTFKKGFFPQDIDMSDHRKFWKVGLANAAIGSTIVGAFILLIKTLASVCNPKISPLFFFQTQREKKFENIVHELNDLSFN
ncbi:hypothetical protein [Legionella hackeliae]|uniref:Uncharacterized protein n=1 Tax=Legionella hackeliae TaxID=449 RepID=A0A0A8ULX4_LEGHA|nr:hypothetical protein [Legionella hackeliae]KTD10237.1 Dot/Icm T4SS effector [Legionella hackeliae]CEK09733.1 protein of unknown function [Legionella hackeliae]STX49643.1 Dot/Icm T4SS effector [Legionella hackeliae]